MTKDGICSLFNDPNSCIRAVSIMKESDLGTVTWLFDDAKEYVYFKRLPILLNGYYYVIGQGTQSDEIIDTFFPYLIVKIITSVILIISIYIIF